MGMTLNLLSLGGLALGVGMLVDSAVVIVENVSTHLDQGKSPEEAVVEGGDEVGGAVTFSILTTVAAFAPIPFASVGVAQRVFSPICTAVIVSQLASWLVSFTFVPSLMSLLLTSQNRRNVGSPSGLAESLARWRSVGSVRAERMLGRWAVPVREYSKRVLTFWKRLPTLAEARNGSLRSILRDGPSSSANRAEGGGGDQCGEHRFAFFYSSGSDAGCG
jgi:multidrug efflux pump subunit AcrB